MAILVLGSSISLRCCIGEKIVNRKPGSFTAEQVELSQVTLSVAENNEVRPTGEPPGS